VSYHPSFAATHADGMGWKGSYTLAEHCVDTMGLFMVVSSRLYSTRLLHVMSVHPHVPPSNPLLTV